MSVIATKEDMKQIIEDIAGIKVRVENINSCVNNLRQDLKEFMKDTSEAHKSLRESIDKIEVDLESYKSRFRGAVMVLGVVVSVIAWLSDRISGVFSK